MVAKIYDGEMESEKVEPESLCTITSQWVNFDLQLRRPHPWDKDLISYARQLGLPTKSVEPLRFQPGPVPNGAFSYCKTVTAEHIDSLGHMNNAVYFAVIMEGIIKAQEKKQLRELVDVDIQASHIQDIKILFENEALEGDIITIFIWNMQDNIQQLYATVTKDKNTLTYAMLTFGSLRFKPKL